MIDETTVGKAEKNNEINYKIVRQLSHASDTQAKVEQWLQNNPTNIKRNVSERKNVPNSRQRIYSDRDVVRKESNVGLNYKKDANHSSTNDIVKMKHVEKWLLSNKLNVPVDDIKVRRLSERDYEKQSSKDLQVNKNIGLSGSNREIARSTNSVNSEKNSKEQKIKEPEIKYKNALIDVDEAKNKNMRKFYNRSTSKDGPSVKPVKIEKQISIHLNDKPVIISDETAKETEVASKVENKVTANMKTDNIEKENAKLKETENTVQVTLEKKPSFNAVKREASFKKNDKVEEKTSETTPKNDAKPSETTKENTKLIADVKRSPSKKFENNEANDKEKIEESVSVLQKPAVETNQVNLVLENEEINVSNSKQNTDEPQKLDIVINHIDVPVKDNEKGSIGIEAISSTTDKDSRELIKKSNDEKSKDEDEEIKKGVSTAFNSAKKQILQNWLKDYRKLASKSPLISKRNKIKRNLEVDDLEKLENQSDANKKAGHGSKHRDKKKYSKKEIEIRKKKSKAYQRKIATLSVIIVVLAISILGVTLGLLIKFLVLDNITNNNGQTTSPCFNACSKGYNSTYYNGKCSCFDINECTLTSTHNCTGLGMLCQNTIGSFICNCTVGYSLQNGTCIDVNECDSNVCDFVDTFGCINTIGSYKCICAAGYEWSQTIQACVDTNECFNSDAVTYSNICGQNKTCINTIGSYACDCAIGYQPISSGSNMMCIEIDECKLNSPLYKCPYPYSCVNTEGSYSCCQNNSQVCQTCGLQYVYPISRIIGGADAIAHSWPWMVSIGINFKYTFFVPLLQADYVQWINKTNICGGVLISNRYVLTAAHCVSNLKVQFLDEEVLVTTNKDQPTLESIFTVYIGIQYQDYDTLDPNNIYKVEKIFVHEKYDPVSYLNDIALIRLEKPVKKTVNTDWICIANSYGKDFDPMSSKVYAIGFGVTLFGSTDQSNTLKQVDLSIYPFSTCNSATLPTFTDPNSQICAGDLSGKKDTCQGDSGSPLMYNNKGIWYVIGIVSYGRGCAINNYAGIYTNVTYYKNWINSKIF